MPETVSFEEAKRCPKCGNPGKETGASKVASGPHRGDLVHYIQCQNKLCLWFETEWIVQTNEKDGRVPVREAGPRGMDKDFPALSEGAKSRARALVEQTEEDLKKGETRL